MSWWTPRRRIEPAETHDVRKKAERAATIAVAKVQNFLDFSNARNLDIENVIYRCKEKYEQLKAYKLAMN